MALYLKYRPQNFADVVGQDHIVTTLEQANAQGRLSHAYLFCGTRGTGKTSVARILAKTILLKGIEDEVLRGHIEKAIEEGSLVDLIEIDAASNRRIDDIRELIDKINFSPSVSKAKVYIIDEVHMLTKEAFNALLKTLEEPPEYAYFILATTELHKVPDTIQSRCQRFLFKRVKEEDIIRRLQYIVDQERIQVDRDALRAIARHASGSFRDGISLLDQLRSLPKITLNDVTERIGRTTGVFLEEILVALEKKELNKLAELVEQMEEANIPLDAVAGDLLSLVRSQMREAMEKGESPAPFLHMTDTLLQALKDMRASPLPGLVLESALITLSSGETTSKPATIKAPPAPLPRIKPVERHDAPTPSPVAPAPQASVADAPKPGLIEAEDFTAETVRKHWPEVLKVVTPPSVRMSLKDASIENVTASTLRLSFTSSFHKEKIADTKASRTVEDALLAIFRKQIRIECVFEKSTAMPMAGPSTDLAEAAAEVFGGL